jgi:Holliday junction DNA helicase RuvB
MIGVDCTGLTVQDIELMSILYENDGPVGLDNLTIKLNESKQVLLERIEPYLIQRGLIQRSQRGRVITDAGINYLFDNGYIKSDKNSWIDIPANYKRRL